MVKEEELDYSVMSTYEIKLANKKAREKKKQEKPEEDVTALIRKMTAREIQDYLVLKCDDTTTMKVRVLQLKALQNIEQGYYNILQIHGYIKFNEESRLKVFMKECLTPRDPSFINRLVKYCSQHCYLQTNFEDILKWKHMMAVRTEYDWVKAFNNSVLSAPERETELLAAQIMLLPNPTAKHANRVLASLAKQKKLPACFELLIRTIFKNVDHSALTKSDVEIVMGIFLHTIFEKCLKWKKDTKEENFKNRDKKRDKSKNEEEISVEILAQNKFLDMSSELANQAFGILQKSDEHAAQMLLHDPAFKMERPSNLFIEYFFQYCKLGIFCQRAEKLIAWNYYYDDRWCGYDRPDLFGDDFEILDRDQFCTDFKYAGTFKDHPYHNKLSLTARVYQWMSADPVLLDNLMNKYWGDDVAQYFCVALSFANMFKETRDLYKFSEPRVKSRIANFSIRLCYIYSCAKDGMAKEALLAWVDVMRQSVINKKLKTLKFDKNSFPLPFFVKIEHCAQFATRLLRNCLFTAAVKNGTEAWKKYGFILLTLCNLLESTFLNHNMIRIIFQKIPIEDMHLLVRPGLLNCFRDNDAYIDCLHTAKSRGFEIPASVINETLDLDQWAKREKTPGFLVFFNRLIELDELFFSVVDGLPLYIFNENEVKEDKKEGIQDLPSETQEAIIKIVDYCVTKAKKLEKRRKEMEKMEEEKEQQLLKQIAKSNEFRQSEEYLMKQRMQDQGMGTTSSYYDDEYDNEEQPYIDPAELERAQEEAEEERMRQEEIEQEEALNAYAEQYDAMRRKERGEDVPRQSYLDRLKDVVEKLPNPDEPKRKRRRRARVEREDEDEDDEEMDMEQATNEVPSDSEQVEEEDDEEESDE